MPQGCRCSVTAICCELATYHLNALRPIHDLAFTKEIYERNLAILKDVRDGKLTLGLSADNREPTDPASPAVVTDINFGGDPLLPQRMFTRGTLKGF